MRRIMSAIALLAAVPGTALACDANPVCTVKDPTGTPMNIRMGPNETVIGTAPDGTQLEFIDHVEHKGKIWARVARFRPEQDVLNYGDGFVFAAYLKCPQSLAEGGYDDPVACTVADPTGTPLNVRSGPNGEVLGTVRNGEVLRVFNVTSRNAKLWAQAWRDPSDNAVGWVFDDYLACEEDAH